MDFTEDGIEMEIKYVHSSNTDSSMLVRKSGSLAHCRLVLPLKAEGAILVTELGITTLYIPRELADAILVTV